MQIVLLYKDEWVVNGPIRRGQFNTVITTLVLYVHDVLSPPTIILPRE